MSVTETTPSVVATSDRLPKIARSIKTFVDHPITKLVVGLILVVTSSVETFHSFQDDVTHLRLRIHHGLLVVGFINILAAMPGLIEGIERFLTFREKVPSLRESNHE